MTIKICDAIMGSGKSSAAINYMNSNPDRKFIYITPFLEEASRIKQACPDLHFKEPSNKLPEHGFSKSKHIGMLLQNGENVTSTHSLFMRFNSDIIEAIRGHGYTLIIDEDVECMNKCDTLHRDDLQMLDDKGFVVRVGSSIMFRNYDGYHGYFRELMERASETELVDVCPETDGKTSLFYWIYPKRILEAFSEVFVLTYMFNAQTIKWYFDMEGMPYQYIHTAFDGKTYSFTDGAAYVPDYIRNVKDRIHICGTKRMNKIGDERCDLSVSWYQKQGEDGDGIAQLSKNLHNYFNIIMKDIPTADRRT